MDSRITRTFAQGALALSVTLFVAQLALIGATQARVWPRRAFFFPIDPTNLCILTYSIDVIIRRTLIYGALTAMLALFYFGSVVALQEMFRSLTGQASDIAIIVSTLAIAALSNPLRYRMQQVIDHRFYRRKYDAQKVLAQFGAAARDQVELDRLTNELVAVVEETVQPASVSLWVQTESRRGIG